MATPVFVDTGAHYALADVQDPDHAEAVRLLQQIVRLRYALVTSNFVISEVYTLLRQRLGWEAAIHYVEELRVGSTQVISVTTADEERAWEILRRYDDQDFSYVDATSFSVFPSSEEVGSSRISTLGRRRNARAKTTRWRSPITSPTRIRPITPP